jgi:hypothetical protein
MQTAQSVTRRPRCPDRCLRAPNAFYDRGFAILLCGNRDGYCSFRGAVYVLDADGRRYECQKPAAKSE